MKKEWNLFNSMYLPERPTLAIEIQTKSNKGANKFAILSISLN